MSVRLILVFLAVFVLVGSGFGESTRLNKMRSDGAAHLLAAKLPGDSISTFNNVALTLSHKVDGAVKSMQSRLKQRTQRTRPSRRSSQLAEPEEKPHLDTAAKSTVSVHVRF